MNSISQLVGAYREGKLTLETLLEALSLRGAVSPSVHRSELEMLHIMQAEGSLAAEIAQAVQTRLQALQTEAPPINFNATLARPIKAYVPPGDATEFKAPAAPAAPPKPVDATVVRTPTVQKPSAAPPPPLPPPAAATATQTAATAIGSSTSGTASGTSANKASWERIASAAGGDHVTVGSMLKGRFLLEKEIGRGGMGVVYLALDERKVEARDRDPYLAVKVLNDEFRRHPDSLIALQRESRRSQQLAHDNIVRVFDFDKDGTIVYMTMEYIDGSDLKGLIRERAFNGMPLKEAQPLIEGMARGLGRAHASGVVHSDFKPGNVMVTRGGVPKVFDFGIARAGKHGGDAMGETTVFDAGTLGALTPAYASLEMIQGHDPEPSDDIYALGCVCFELLTGKHPFDKHSAEVAMREGRKPPPVRGLTKRQYKTLCAAVAFKREDRLRSTEALVEGLRELSTRERAMPWLLAGVPSLLLLVAGGFGYNSYRHSQNLETLVQRFAVDRPGHFADEGQAQQALEALDDDDRKRLVSDHSDQIQAFLLSRVASYWNPAEARYDFAKAQQVFALRDRLRLFSPGLDARRIEVEKQKNDRLNALDTQLTAQIDADAIFEAQPENALATLASIQTIDPASGLLKNAQLELKYDVAIGNSLDEGRIDEAKQRLTLANRYFAESPRLKLRATQLDELAKAMAAQQSKQDEAQKAEREQGQLLQTLAGLIEHPKDADDWRNQAAEAYRAAKKQLDADPRLATQEQLLRQALAAQVREKQASGNATAAIAVAGFGIDLFAGDATLAAARQALVDQQNRLAQEAQTKAQRIEKAQARFAEVLARPLGTAVWLQDAKTALADLRTQVGEAAPEAAEARTRLDASIAKLARERLAAKALDEAERIARGGQQINPGAAAYGALLAEIAQARAAAKNRNAEEQVQKLAEARKTLAGLSAKPVLSADWQRAVAAALAVLKGDASPETQRLVSDLGDAIAAEAAKLGNPQQLPQSRLAVEFGLRLVPNSPRLLEQRANIEKLQRDTQARLNQESTEAEVKSRIESVKSAAAANDVQKARESLARIRALRPDDPFLKTEGPGLLASAYLRFADDVFQRKNYQDAADVLGQALKVLGERPELRAARQRYELVAALKKAGNQPLPAADYQRLKKQLDELRRSDSAALAKLEGDLKARGQLPEKSLAERLEKLKPGTAAPLPGQAATAPSPVPQGPAASPRPGAAPPPAVPQPGVIPAPTLPGAKPPVAAAPPSAPRAGSEADPCNKPELVGSGKQCFDTLGERKGPRLVVVPGLGGGRPYALGRAEVSVANFNEFCAATQKCASRAAGDADFANMPISNISSSQAEAYAAWLSASSGGYTYRLPTDAEWAHAAKAGGFKQAEDSNCVPPSASPGTGTAVSPKGRDANPWGLVHMSGNVWEWVSSGGGLAVRGASYNEYWSDCTVDAKRSDNGSPKPDVGFRILRELK